MHNCHEDIVAYHNDEVTLPDSERAEMRKRRNVNRDRLKKGLRRDDKPSPIGCRSQGSYAMRTMVQQGDKDYDIDDGVYFNKEKLKGPQGGDKSANDAKEMVRQALHDESFNRAPEKLKNCVRVYYQEGYHVDVPVYRELNEKNVWGAQETWYELASTEWKRSDPLAVTNWLLDENRRQSPGKDNGGQLRRIVRFLKAFARSRRSWRAKMATGFMITKLVVEEYHVNSAREDRSLYDTMVGIRDRLMTDLEIDHPTVDGAMLTKGPNDPRTRFLREKLDWAIGELKVLFEPGCTRKKALEAWDIVFNTTFFSDRIEDTHSNHDKGKHAAAATGAAAAATAAVLAGAAKRDGADAPVDKRGGGRFA